MGIGPHCLNFTHLVVGKFQFSVPRVDLEYIERRTGLVRDSNRQLDGFVDFDAQDRRVVGCKSHGGEIGHGTGRNVHKGDHDQDDCREVNHTAALERDVEVEEEATLFFVV